MGTIWFAFLVLQPTQEEDVWKPLKYFVGEWRGQESGSAGVGRGERNYELAIGGQYLVSRNTSVFEPQEKNPSGE
ncbi:MAG TPA: hypothetical protein VEK15_02515, partial [Vicinamibacteria bacterium]|nr:hypothetical protein [Vicinamibacteria bacterium]